MYKVPPGFFQGAGFIGTPPERVPQMLLRIPGNGQCSQPSSLHLLASPLATLSWHQVSAFAACAEPLLHRVGFVGSAWGPGGSFQTGACKTSPSWMPGAPDLAPRSPFSCSWKAETVLQPARGLRLHSQEQLTQTSRATAGSFCLGSRSRPRPCRLR